MNKFEIANRILQQQFIYIDLLCIIDLMVFQHRADTEGSVAAVIRDTCSFEFRSVYENRILWFPRCSLRLSSVLSFVLISDRVHDERYQVVCALATDVPPIPRLVVSLPLSLALPT